MRPVHDRTANGAAAGHVDRGQLSVVVGCHAIVCALPVTSVVRLVLPDEVEPVAGAPGTVAVGGELFASWDLGRLLGLAPLGEAVVLCRIPDRQGDVPVALHTGRCVVVQKVAAERGLPAALFRERGRGFLGAFRVPEGPNGAKLAAASYGILLDPIGLLDGAELAASRRRIEVAERRRSGS